VDRDVRVLKDDSLLHQVGSPMLPQCGQTGPSGQRVLPESLLEVPKYLIAIERITCDNGRVF
jgi:hypothetical protein